MCGIVGFAGITAPGLLDRMCQAIEHRGPDDLGQVEFSDIAISIGMRRLSIIDIEGGRQPVVSPDGRIHLVFNGEIYNHAALAAELREKGHVLRSRCDTEVVLTAYIEWGQQAWQRLQGMFAIALIDRREASPQLHLIRDRVGMKPLYYWHDGGRLIFGSEIKALLQWENMSPEIDLSAVVNYLALRYVPGPRSMFEGVQKLEPGHRLCFSGGQIHRARWWSPPTPTRIDAKMRAADAAAQFGDALRQAVRSHMIADVPVGAFLSGGVDSNTIVALMAEASSDPVRTFSIGFPDFPDHDRDLAAKTAAAFGTIHTPIECRPEDMSALPEIAWMLDEPVGDAIVVPMYVLSREAHKQVKVVLSGEGADEILGGYVFHRNLASLDRMNGWPLRSAWPVIGAALNMVPTSLLDRVFDYPGTLGKDGRRKISRLLSAVGREDLPSLYRRATSLFDEQDMEEAGGVIATLARSAPPPHACQGTALQRMVHMQFPDWLPDDILMKADKMSMAHSLEARIPFMDEAVIAAAAAIPDHLKLSRTENKSCLRDVARALLPIEVASAPKRAFYIPLESYMNAPQLADLMRAMLDPVRLKRRGLISPDWAKHQLERQHAGGFLPLKRIFSVVMLELWFERFCPDASWA